MVINPAITPPRPQSFNTAPTLLLAVGTVHAVILDTMAPYPGYGQEYLLNVEAGANWLGRDMG
ncbi:MAG: hypothetical protein LJE75_05095 [Gammaproteobacteria bacterium]|nr:hypothetical protein [Gammaproteobacteria bacterium]